MSEYFGLLFSSLHGTTIVLYTFIFVLSSFLGFKCQRKEWYGTEKINKKTYIILFLFLCIFYAFNDVGVDTPHYRHYFILYKDFNSLDEGYGAVEKLYQLLNVGLNLFFSSSYWAVAFIRIVQLAIFFYALYMLRSRTIIGFAIMAYVAFFYFDAFNLLRSSLAGSLAILSFAYLNNRRFLLAIFCAIVAMGFHTSAIFLLLTIGIYLLCYETALVKFQRIIPTVATIMLFIVLSVGGDYINILLADDFGGGRYDYIEASSKGIGLFVLLKYFPPIAVLYILKKFKSEIIPKSWINLNFVWLIVGFAIALLAYQVGMLTRVAIYFSSPFLFLMPYFCVQLFNKRSPNYKTVFLLFIAYYTFMFCSTMGGLYDISELGPFKFF